MDDRIRLPSFHRLSYLLAVGYIEFRASWGRDVLFLEDSVQGAAELTQPAGNQDAHACRFGM